MCVCCCAALEVSGRGGRELVYKILLYPVEIEVVCVNDWRGGRMNGESG